MPIISMSLTVVLLSALTYLIAVAIAWFSVVYMRKQQSIVRGLPLWVLSAALGVLASQLFEKPLIFAVDFITHINAVVLIGLCVLEYHFFKERHGLRMQLYWLNFTAAFVVAILLIVDYFMPLKHAAIFLATASIPILFGIIYILAFLWTTFTQAHLRVLGALSVVAITSKLALFVAGKTFSIPIFYVVSLDILLRALTGTFVFFLIVGYLIALDTRHYHATRRHFSVGRAIWRIGAVCAVSSITYAGIIFWMPKQEAPYIAQRMDVVTVRLNWLPQTEYAGMYVADQKGYYEENGIEAAFLPFGFDISPIDDVAHGAGTFGVAGASSVLEARSEGVPVVTLATIYQRSPVVLLMLASSTIHTPADLKGRSIGVGIFSQGRIATELILAEAGLTLKDVHADEGAEGFEEHLISGRVDAMIGFSTNQPFFFAKKGIETRTFSTAKQLYSDTVFTTDRVVAENPELVQRFVSATLRGWEYAIAHPEEAVEITMLYGDDEKYGPMDKEHQRSMLDTSAPLIKPTRDFKIGSMDETVWTTYYDVLRAAGVITEPVSMKDVFTAQFLGL